MYYLKFFENHGLLDLLSSPIEWRTVDGGSKEYVDKIIRRLGKRVFLGTPVKAITRSKKKCNLLAGNGFGEMAFDKVILACHADQSSEILIENFSVETFIKQSEINYLGVIKSFDAFIKKMLLSRSGTVLIMSSIAGWIGLPKASAYAPTKSALRSFAQSIRYDLAKYNIVVKLCSPGFVNTKAVKVNDFKMPGLIEPNVAAKIILKNINSKKFEITFPWLFSALMKFLTYLPDNLSYKLIKYVTLYEKEK